MRAFLFLVPLVVLFGCGSGSHDEAAFAKNASVASAAPMMSESFKGAGGFATRDLGGKGRSQDMAAAKAEAPQATYGMADKAAPKPELASMQTPVPTPRMVVRHAQIGLRVTSVEDAERKVGDVARSLNGSVEASAGTNLSETAPTMSVTLRVPETRFDDALRQLEKLGTRLNKTISSEDVTAQAVDLDARVKSLRVQEDAYRAILAAARRISDVLEIQEKLTGVRTEIEEIVAQRRGLGDQAARSTIEVSLAQATPPAKAEPTAPKAIEPGWLAATWGDATGSLLSVVRFLLSVAVWVLVMLPVWAPLGVAAFVVYRRSQKAVV